ncbi:glutathione S-transferase [Vibrio anguillarum]|uniref:Glutathione S-transferase n=13 Tax=Vibrio TaxID=662 RepID=A0A1Q1GH13_VIBAN|nr:MULTISPECIES: glutathione S-transferase [Vibrio]AEH34463.1 Glutathione S-transferase [Vibrio anguillarum 775]AGU59077.1 glutathione S-transferase [Vibrio anguillarum M3]ASF93751.1 glutathione S-transferase [Vibrio anguillarum]ASG09318.1 glutathione S-transferase [Vibrio anguillarum]ASO30899.1 glutathione S-transferase [Vibrio anguillarum]
MKLYELAATPSCRRVNIFLKEIGIDIPRQVINVRDGENLSDEFQSKSITGKIPVLELDDGTTLCESIAICRYFDHLVNHKHFLFGQTALEQAKVEMWHRVVEFQGLYAGFQAFRNISGIYKDRENCIVEWGYESRNRVGAFLPILDERLSESEYLATDAFTIVDITAYIFIEFAENALELTVLKDYSNIARWFKSVEQRPSFHRGA